VLLRGTPTVTPASTAPHTTTRRLLTWEHPLARRSLELAVPSYTRAVGAVNPLELTDRPGGYRFYNTVLSEVVLGMVAKWR
jgi:hypothetical protein